MAAEFQTRNGMQGAGGEQIWCGVSRRFPVPVSAREERGHRRGRGLATEVGGCYWHRNGPIVSSDWLSVAVTLSQGGME